MQFASAKHLFFLLLTVMVLASCDKKDEIPPNVTFVLPLVGQTYNVYDTVHVRIEAIDETGLSHVYAQIVDDSFIPIGASVSINISPSTNTGSAEIVIDDKLLLTADYYVVASASDGVNESRGFRKIRIVALPKERRAVYFSTAGQANQIWKVDSLFDNSLSWVQPSEDVLKLCVNSQEDRITTVGNISPKTISYDIHSKTQVWSDQTASVNQVQRYTTITCFENTTYTGLYDKEVRSYGLNGVLTMNELTGNYQPKVIFAEKDYLLIAMDLIGGNSHHLFVYHRQTKVLLWQQLIPMDIKAICSLQGDEVLLFGNDESQARVLHYDIGDNGWWEPRNLPSGTLSDATQMEPGNFAIAHESGLYSYTYNPNFLNMLSADNYQDIVFDVDNNTVVGASQNVVNEVSIVNGATINTISQTDSITSLDIHYTR